MQKRVTYGFSPELLMYDSGDLVGSPFMVLGFIAGIHVTNSDTLQLKTVITSIHQAHAATTQKRRHSDVKDYFREIYAEKFGETFIPDSTIAADVSLQIVKLADKLHSKMKSLPLSPSTFECLFHGDLNPNNLLRHNESVYFIDWEPAR